MSLLTSLCSHRGVWLLVFIAAMATKTQAQYELTVYDDNSHKRYTETTDDIKCPFLKSGKISFNAEMGEVTLDNVVYENPRSGVDGRFIGFSYGGTNGKSGKLIVKGTNKITCKGDKPIQFTLLNCTIIRELEAGCTAENCVLDITCLAGNAYGICLNKSGLFVSNCTVKVHGGYYGIGGWGYDVTQTMGTTEAIIYAQGSKGSIADISSLSLGGDKIQRPEGAAFNSSLHGVALDGSLVTDEVLICKDTYVPKDATAPVPGDMNIIPYASDNRAYVSWEPATDDQTLQANLEYRLRYKKKDEGSDWITAFDWTKGRRAHNITGLLQGGWYYIDLEVRDEAGNAASYSWRSFRVPVYRGLWVEGMEVTDSNEESIPITGGSASYDPSVRTLTLINANIVCYGNEEYGIYNSDQPNLIIKPVGTCHITTQDFGIRIDCNTYINGNEGGTLSVESEYEGTVRGDNNADLILRDCHIRYPIFASYNKTTGRVISWSGSETKDAVTFAPEEAYDLYFSTRVTKANKDDIKTSEIKSGTASYNPDSKTLTLDNVDIISNEDCLMSKIDGLTVKLIGDNKLFSGRDEVIWLLANAKFTGDGTLTVEGDEADGVLLGWNDVTMTIDNTTMKISSNNDGSAIWGGASYSNKKMVIKHSRVTLFSAGTGDTVTGLDALELVNCDFEDGDYYFDPSKKSICDYKIGGYPAGQSDIVIVPTGNTEDIFAYAEYTSSDYTLTFYYDTKKDVRTGTIWTTPSEWNSKSGVKKVVFHPSFADYEVESCLSWFLNLVDLTTIEGIEYLNSSKVKNMRSMFAGCSSLTSIDLSKLNTSNVTIMDNMFAGCSSLVSLNLTNFNTSNVITMSRMFYNCKTLTTLDVSHFNTAKVTNFGSMFHGCEKLAKLDLTNFRTGNVTTMGSMFKDCELLWEIDLTSFNMGKVKSVTEMFANCRELNHIYCNKDWNSIETINSSDDLFLGCSKLKGGENTSYNASRVGLEYARPDGGSKAPGYFTTKWIKGDVNRDGNVDVADIAAIIDVMAGTATYESADVNEDTSVDVADIGSVIDIMAGK